MISKKKCNVNASLDKFIMSVFSILPCYNFMCIHQKNIGAYILHFSEKN